jgi:hypothetical protein
MRRGHVGKPRLKSRSRRLSCDQEIHPSAARGDFIIRLRSDWLPIGKDPATIREQCRASDPQQLLQLAPSTSGRAKGRQVPALDQAGTFRCKEPDQKNCR